MKDGIVNIHGKEYKTVAYRVQELCTQHPEACITTELVSADESAVVMKAYVTVGGQTMATGYAEERRDASKINRTSALENAETSAVGRALAFFGLGGSEIASADEVANAINQQNRQEIEQTHIQYADYVREHFHSIAEIKSALADYRWSVAAECEAEIPRDDLVVLWRAPSKGGVWTTDERTKLKSNEMNLARKEHANGL